MKSILSIALLGLLLSCGNADHAGGTGMDIPNAVTASVIDQAGNPITNARVRVVAIHNWADLVAKGKSVILDSAWTDSNGIFSVKIPSLGNVNIEVIGDSLGISTPFDSNRTTYALETLGSLQAKWKPGSAVRIHGSSLLQYADSLGVVLFPKVPSMNSGLIGIYSGTSPALLSGFQLTAGTVLDVGIQSPVQQFLLLDDFERNTNLTLLNPWLKTSLWYTVADGNDGGSSTITPSTASEENWLTALSDTNAANSRSLNIHYSIQPVQGIYSYAILGCVLGTGLNADAIDSIEFTVISNAPYGLSDGAHPLIQLPATTSAWERVVIHRIDLDKYGITGNIILLQFVFGDTTGSLFRLDDFKIYGDPFSLLRTD